LFCACSNLIYVVYVRVGEVWGLSFIGCCLCQFKIGTLGKALCYLQCLTFFVPHFGMSAWRLKYTKHMGPSNSAVRCRIYVRTEDRWTKEIGCEGLSQVVMKIVMNARVL
jgi:hypothetical protein